MKISATHPDYDRFATQWQRCRDLVAGSDRVKAGVYLPRPSGMDLMDFNVYRARASYFNALGRTVEALTGTILHRPARVSVPKLIEEHLADLTLGDVPIESVTQWIVTELLTVGRCGIMLDMAVEGGAALLAPVQRGRHHQLAHRASR